MHRWDIKRISSVYLWKLYAICIWSVPYLSPNLRRLWVAMADELRSLWLCQINPRIALVLSFAERKRAKDSSVLAFLRQICEGLRGQGILEHSLLQ